MCVLDTPWFKLKLLGPFDAVTSDSSCLVWRLFRCGVGSESRVQLLLGLLDELRLH